MRYVLVAPDDLLSHLAGILALPGEPPAYLVGRPSLRARLQERGVPARSGALEDPAFYGRAVRGRRGPTVVLAPAARLARVVAAVRQGLPQVATLALTDEPRAVPGATTLPLAAIGEQMIRPAVERAETRARVDRIRAHFEGAERVLILIQDDPDPDAIASGLALRAVLGRTRPGAPLATFGAITRPENAALCRILQIEVERVAPRDLRQFQRVALVDVQPAFFAEPLGEVDLVIDHHPVERPVRARLRDVRPGYGATATILTEYLRAADVKVTQRLATALLYGIKSDTLGLERGGTRADLEAFAFLYLLANHNALRRIERPELSASALDVLARGLAHRRIVQGVFFTHLGEVAAPDLIPQFADFGLQAEGVEWSVVSGVVGDNVHVSVRNVGYVRSAGEVVRAAFGNLGPAGGHRTMAKAVVPLASLTGTKPSGSGSGCAERVLERVLQALSRNGGGAARP